MMVGFRIVFGLLLVSGLLCFAAYAYTGNVSWRRWGIAVVKWTVVAGLAFFAVLIVQRLLELS